MSEGALYPLFLKLAGKPVLVVGGGPVAASRIPALLAAGARVTVVAPEIRAEIRTFDVTLHQRRFLPEDLDGTFFAVAAATPDVNREVLRAAEPRHLFVNAVDDPDRATAYTAGVLRRGGVTVAVSTDGEAPALAGLLREGLEAVLPDDLDSWLETARETRRDWKAAKVPIAERRPLLLRALNRIYDERASGAVPAS